MQVPTFFGWALGLFVYRLLGWQPALVAGSLLLHHHWLAGAELTPGSGLAALIALGLILCDIMVARRRSADAAQTPIYFERQKLMFCAVHALNNLFQTEWLSKETLDALADMAAAHQQALCPPRGLLEQLLGLFHWMQLRTPVLGNYDCAAIDQALLLQKCEVHRRGVLAGEPGASGALEPEELDQQLAQPGMRGLILNVQPAKRLWSLFGGRHWMAVVAPHSCEPLKELSTGCDWALLLLDSKQPGPVPIASAASIVPWLAQHGYKTSHVTALLIRQQRPPAPEPPAESAQAEWVPELPVLLEQAIAAQQQLDQCYASKVSPARSLSNPREVAPTLPAVEQPLAEL